MKIKNIALAMAVGFGTVGAAQAAQQIDWWHSMSGVNGEWVNDLAKQFNAKQNEYNIVPVFKGSYDESMSEAIKGYRTGKAPHILQVFEVGTATMQAARGATISVEKVMADAGVKFTPEDYIGAVSGYYTAANGQMMSFPFNSSTTVFYYNKDAFKAAGLNADVAPKTWPEVFAAAKKLKASGHSCPMTIAWNGWTQLESFSAWHNVEFATHANGLGDDGLKARMKVNSPLHVKHITNMQNAAKDGSFVYKGRGNGPQKNFASGECAMIQTSSGFYGELAKNAKFGFGVAPLPFYDDVKGAPQNTVIGGASLWVMGGKKTPEYKGVAKFFEFLSDPAIQSESHKRTGYLPVTNEAFKLTERSGFYAKNPGTDVAVNQMIRKVTDNSRGIRLGNYVQIRAIEDEELEQVWAGTKSADAALNDVVRRGNEVLERFERVNRRR